MVSERQMTKWGGMCVCSCMSGLTEKEHERTFWSDPHVLYIDKDGRWSCQNSANVRLKCVHFIACKFQIKRKNVNEYWTIINDTYADIL